MTLWRSAFYPAAFAVSVFPTASMATPPSENSSPVLYGPVQTDPQTPVSIIEDTSRYQFPNTDYLVSQFENPRIGSELDSVVGYQRNYRWNYEVWGESITGYSIKRSFVDAAGLRSRYIEIGASQPLSDDGRLAARMAIGRAMGQTGPENRGYGVIASFAYKIHF